MNPFQSPHDASEARNDSAARFPILYLCAYALIVAVTWITVVDDRGEVIPIEVPFMLYFGVAICVPLAPVVAVYSVAVIVRSLDRNKPQHAIVGLAFLVLSVIHFLALKFAISDPL